MFTPALTGACLSLFAGGDGAALEAGESPLAYRSYRSFDYELPAETWRPVSAGFPLGGAVEGAFGVALDGTALRVDTDGDGVLDRTVEGKEENGQRFAKVTLKGTDANGAPSVYMARLRDVGQGWEFACSGAVIGQLGDTKVQVFDQDGDGRYDGVGTDAMIVGTGKRAWFLSDTVSIDGRLYSVDVQPDGSSIAFAPYEGPTGTLDLLSSFDTKGKVVQLVVQSLDGSHSFDLARAVDGQAVPAEEYELVLGAIGVGQARVVVSQGDMDSILVDEGDEVALEWGGPLRAEFAYHRQGGQLVIQPDEVWYYGAAGEMYTGWTPRGMSPEFTITKARDGEEVAKAIFPGTT